MDVLRKIIIKYSKCDKLPKKKKKNTLEVPLNYKTLLKKKKNLQPNLVPEASRHIFTFNR